LTSGNFASGSADRTITIWSSTTETLLTTLSEHTLGVTGLAALNDDRLASVSSDGFLRIWSANSTTSIRSIPISGSGLSAIAKLPNGLVAVALIFDNSIRVYDPNTGNRSLPNFPTNHTDAVKVLTVLSNGNLASGSNDRTIKIWNSETRTLIRTLTGHTGFVLCLKEIGSDLASGSTDLKIKIWDLTTGLEKKSINSFHRPNSIEYLSNGYMTGGTQLGFLDFYDPTKKIYRIESYGSFSLISQLKLASGNLVLGDSNGALRILKF
jgi:WD40 repeat protein